MRRLLIILSVLILVSPAFAADSDLAQKALGTHGLKDTVEEAFHEAIRRDLRARLATRIETGAGIDRSPEILSDSRPTR